MIYNFLQYFIIPRSGRAQKKYYEVDRSFHLSMNGCPEQLLKDSNLIYNFLQYHVVVGHRRNIMRSIVLSVCQ